MRPLVADSNGIVVAAPTDPLYVIEQGHPVAVQRAKFRVERVLMGDGLTDGQEITVQLNDEYALADFRSQNGKAEVVPLNVTHAILHLRPAEKDGSYSLMLSGLHCVTQDGRVFMPFQWSNPGWYCVERVMKPSWEELLAMVSKEVEALQSVRAMERIADPHERDLAVLGWIRQHRTEMAESPYIHYEGPGVPRHQQ